MKFNEVLEAGKGNFDWLVALHCAATGEYRCHSRNEAEGFAQRWADEVQAEVTVNEIYEDSLWPWIAVGDNGFVSPRKSPRQPSYYDFHEDRGQPDPAHEAACDEEYDGGPHVPNEEGRLPDAFDHEAQADLERHNEEFPDGYGRPLIVEGRDDGGPGDYMVEMARIYGE
jgi:hypothetical protein